MALLGFESFDSLAIGDISLRGWAQTSNGFLTASIVAGLTGNSLSMNSAAGGFAFYERAIVSPLSFVAVQGAFRPNNVSGTFFAVREGSVYHFTLAASVAGAVELRLGNGGTLLASSAPGIIASLGWRYLEVEATIANSGGNVTVWIDGTEVINYTGDTNNGGAVGLASSFCLGVSGANTVLWDDVVWLDDTGAAPYNGTIGAVRIDTLLPTSDGATTDFTPSAGVDNFAMVDETLPDGDTTYNDGGTVGNKDILGLANLTGPSGTIFAVQTRVRARRTDAGAVELTPSIISDGVEGDGTPVSLSASYTELRDIFTLNPDGSVAWDDAAVNALQVAYRISA